MSKMVIKLRMTELEAFSAWKEKIWNNHKSIYLKDLYFATQRESRLTASLRGAQPIFLDDTLQNAYDIIESESKTHSIATARVSTVGMFGGQNTKSPESAEMTEKVKLSIKQLPR